MTASVATPATLFRRTGGEDFPDFLKALISGPPKSGKTSLLGSVPNIVIADTEPFANNLQSVAHLNLPYVPIHSSADLQRLLFVLRDPGLRAKAAEQLGMDKIEAVGVDTLDTLQKIMKQERMREQRTSKFLRDDWGWLKEELTKIVEAFTQLPLHVFFTVHLKTKDVGSEENPRTIILPGLEGGFSEEIAGMVGYSLLAFRKEEVRPDGTKYTKYWLRAEGDETYEFLGNRTAGRLPDVIEPKFGTIYEAARAGRLAIHAPVQPGPMEIPAANGHAPAAPAPAPVAPAPVAAAPAPAPAAEKAAQNPGSSAEASPPATEQPQPAPATTAPTPDGQPAAAKPGDDEPINAAALQYTQKVYEAAGLEYPEALIRGLTVGQARSLVRMWQAIQQDSVEGKLEAAPNDEMAKYLLDMDWLADSDKARLSGEQPAAPKPAEPVPPVPDVTGTIDQVMAYIGDDLVKAQEAYDLEIAKPKPRATLINALVSKGVKVQTPVQNEPAPVAAEPAPPAESPAPAPAPEASIAAPVAEPAPVTPAAPSVEAQGTDDPQEQQAMALLQNELGAVPIDADGKALPCEECQGEIDDEDIATLSKSRFGRRLCVTDYIAETKKPRG